MRDILIVIVLLLDHFVFVTSGNVVVGGVTARDKQGVHATVNCEASPPPVTENCGRVTISYFHIVTARVSSTFCDSLYHLL